MNDDIEDTAFGPVRRPSFEPAVFAQAILADFQNSLRASLGIYGPSRRGHYEPPTPEQLERFEAFKAEFERMVDENTDWVTVEDYWFREPHGPFVYDETEEEFARREAEWRAQVAPDGVVHIPTRRTES